VPCGKSVDTGDASENGWMSRGDLLIVGEPLAHIRSSRRGGVQGWGWLVCFLDFSFPLLFLNLFMSGVYNKGTIWYCVPSELPNERIMDGRVLGERFPDFRFVYFSIIILNTFCPLPVPGLGVSYMPYILVFGR